MSKQRINQQEEGIATADTIEQDAQKEVGTPRAYIAIETSTIKYYDINKPFAYVNITKNPLTNEMVYEILESKLIEKETKQIENINRILIETLDKTMTDLGSEENASQHIEKNVKKIVKKYGIKIKPRTLDKILYYIKRQYIGYGRIDVLMKDPLIEDISCNGVNIPIYVWHRDFESIPTNVAFESEEDLDSFIIRLAYRSGRMISIANPLLDAILPDGSRIQMSFGKQVTKHGSTFTIRKFKLEPLTIIDLIQYNTLSSDMAALLWLLVENKLSVFVCGGIASGKTTMLNCLSSFIKPDSKIVTIEDTPELQLYHRNWIRSVTRSSVGAASEISLFDLLKASVRQRPDYIVVGEIRGEEAYTLFQAMATGHLGMATLHAESVTAAIHRLEAQPMNIPLKLIAGLNVITIQARMEKNDQPIRRTTTMAEIVGLTDDGKKVITNELFTWDPKKDTYNYSENSHYLNKIARTTSRTMDEIIEDIKMRKVVLDWMLKKRKRNFLQVTEIIRNYEMMPEEVYKLATRGEQDEF